MSQDEKENIKQEINKAINFLGQNKFTEAENACLKIIESGDNADAFHILSSIKIYQQEFEESIKYVRKSIDIDNSNPGYHVTLGCAHSSMKNYSDSIVAFQNAIKINGKIAQVHFYLGESYRKLKKYNDAISSFYNTIELSPDHSGAHMLLGIVYQQKKQFDLSIKSFEKCIEIMPDYPEAHLNLGLCLLLVGDYENGWREFEWRRKLWKYETDKLKKEWTGQNLENKTILVLDESSDENLIHFIRFVRDLKIDSNCKIIHQCRDDAKELVAMQDWIDEVVTDSDYPDHDYFIPNGSFMNVLKYNPNHHQQHFPYINVTPENHGLCNRDAFNVGLVYETKLEPSVYDDESIDPRLFDDVFTKAENVVCLDSNILKSELPKYCSSQTEKSDLLYLSQVINDLDLVVTVDHIVAHLAGALNVDTILMLPCVPNWRWDLNHRDNSIWYRSIKTFRQPVQDDWTTVIEKLKKYISETKNGRISD